MLLLFTLAHALQDFIVTLNIPNDVDAVSLQQLHQEGMRSAKAIFGPSEKIKDRFMTGFLATMKESTAHKLSQNANIAHIEPDNEVNIAESGFYVKKPGAVLQTQNHAPWGVCRLSSGPVFKDNGVYVFPSAAGANVDVYILDTGIDVSHEGLNAEWGLNLVEGSPDTDEHGHGTHVAGTIAGKGTGIAKKANLIAVKILDKSGAGKISRVILGIDYVIRMHAKKEDELYENYKKDSIEYTVSTDDVRKSLMQSSRMQGLLTEIINETSSDTSINDEDESTVNNASKRLSFSGYSNMNHIKDEDDDSTVNNASKRLSFSGYRNKNLKKDVDDDSTVNNTSKRLSFDGYRNINLNKDEDDDSTANNTSKRRSFGGYSKINLKKDEDNNLTGNNTGFSGITNRKNIFSEDNDENDDFTKNGIKQRGIINEYGYSNQNDEEEEESNTNNTGLSGVITGYKKLLFNKEKIIDKKGKQAGNSNKYSYVVPKSEKSPFLDKLADHLKLSSAKPRTVVNMSVGGLKSRALEFAVDYASKTGIHFAVAAGNDHEDACMYSPGSSKSAITVGASTKKDMVAFFSNIGKCVDIFAPGAEILSTWPGGEFRTASGTSMASPHVAGAMALYLSLNYYDPIELKAKIINDGLSVILNDDDEDMLDFWPLKYLFNRQKYRLVSIDKLNQEVKQ